MRTLLLAVVLFGYASIAAAQSPSVSDESTSLVKAHEAIEHDHADEAIAILQPLASAQPPIKAVQHELGLAYYSSGNLMKAKQAFEQAVQEDPSDMESVQLEGLVLYRLGQPAAAIPYLERVRGWMPNANADANYVLGLCYMNARRYEEARRSFAMQFGENPDSAEAYLLMGTMLMHANLEELAAEQARKALQISPNLPLAHFMLGEVALFNQTPTKQLRSWKLNAASILVMRISTIGWVMPTFMPARRQRHSNHSPKPSRWIPPVPVRSF